MGSDNAVYINTRADVKRYLLHISNGYEFIAGVLADGSLEYGPNYTPDGAAKAFWEAMAYHSPVGIKGDLCVTNKDIQPKD